MIPNMTVLSPKNKWELADMVRFAVKTWSTGSSALSEGSAFDGFREYRAPIEYGKSEPVYEEEDIAIISVGHMFEQAVQVRKRLKEIGYNCTLINARFVKPVDEEDAPETDGGTPADRDTGEYPQRRIPENL